MIGLGGTGGRVLRALRKSAFQAFQDQPVADLGLDYLLVDSDPRSFAVDDLAWVVQGRSLQLPPRNQLQLGLDDVQAIIDDIDAYPLLKPWMGSKTAWQDVLAGSSADAAGLQNRRLGRLRFAMSASRFRDAVGEIVQDLQQRDGSSADIVFHIFCGLAEASSSGAIVDVVAQLRQMFPGPRQRILLYLNLPEGDAAGSWDSGGHLANAYAALLELNAMSAGVWSPFDVVKGGGPVITTARQWFNGAYVYSDENTQSYRASISRDLPDIVADFVFQKVVVTRNIDWDELARMENAENGDAAPEAAPGAKAGHRSVRFMSFGVRRLVFPEAAIAEALAGDFEVQGLNHIAYNNWEDGSGYLEQEQARDDTEFVADLKKREEWRVTDDHLRLQRPIADTDAANQWRPFDEEWKEWEDHLVDLARQAERAEWLTELNALFDTAWEQNFRGTGVPKFLEAADRDRGDLAKAVRNRVEVSLFQEWSNGAIAITEAGRFVDALLLDIEQRASAVGDFVARRKASFEHLERQFAEIERGWEKMRPLPGMRERELGNAGFVLREHYVARTLSEAARFSRTLMDELLRELLDLKTALVAAERTVVDGADRVKDRVRAQQNALTPMTNQPSHVTNIGDLQTVDKTRRRLLLSAEEMRAHTVAFRRQLVATLGPAPTFATLARRLGEPDVQSVLDSVSAKSVALAHDRLVTDRRDRIIGVSIIDKLHDQWGDEQERLDREVAMLAGPSTSLIEFDEDEINKAFPGRRAAARAVETFAVVLPAAADQPDFVEKLGQAFRHAHGSRKVELLTVTDGRSDEIALISIVNLFPLRFVRLVAPLKDQYDNRMADGRARAALEMHIEGDGRNLPDLYTSGGGKAGQLQRPALLVGLALGTITTTYTQSTGRDMLVLVRRDADGFNLEPVLLGTSLFEAAESLGEGEYYTLAEANGQALSAGALLTEESRAAARDKIMASIASVRANRAGDITDPDVVAWESAAREAMRIIRREG
jgi:hypothetical protein